MGGICWEDPGLSTTLRNPKPQEEQSRAVQNTPAMAGCGAAFCGVVNAIQL